MLFTLGMLLGAGLWLARRRARGVTASRRSKDLSGTAATQLGLPLLPGSRAGIDPMSGTRDSGL